MADEEQDKKDPAQSRQPSTVDAVLPEYISLHESTGETYESMADRVEAQGSTKLAERLRKLKNDSEAHKANKEINSRAAAEARSTSGQKRTEPPQGRQAPSASTT